VETNAPAAPTPKPNNTNRNILIALGAAVLFCICVCGVAFVAFRKFGEQISRQIENSDNPAQVESVRSKIASYNVPPGYTEQMALELGMYRMLALVPDDPAKPLIMLMGYNQGLGVDSQQMQQQLQRSLEQQANTPGLTWTTVEERAMTIRGQEILVVVREGATEDGLTMRQMMLAFEGENGTVIVMAQGDAANWDQGLLDDFLESIE
jgi:hypothetical protein